MKGFMVLPVHGFIDVLSLPGILFLLILSLQAVTRPRRRRSSIRDPTGLSHLALMHVIEPAVGTYIKDVSL